MEDDKESGRTQITTWEILKKEIKEQFLLSNASWMARESLNSLKHMGAMREYVKEFSSLMLDIKNMFDDKLFNFMYGLQGWAQAELWRQGVQDFPTTIAVVDCLVVMPLPLLGRREGDAARDCDSLTYFSNIGGPISYIIS